MIRFSKFNSCTDIRSFFPISCAIRTLSIHCLAPDLPNLLRIVRAHKPLWPTLPPNRGKSAPTEYRRAVNHVLSRNQAVTTPVDASVMKVPVRRVKSRSLLFADVEKAKSR